MRNFKFAVPSKAMCGCLLYECGGGVSNTRYGPPMNRRVGCVCLRSAVSARTRFCQTERETECTVHDRRCHVCGVIDL